MPAARPTQQEWENQIARAPNDRRLYQVYADWLQENGDPAGEWIALHCREDLSEKKLEKERKRLLAEQKTDLLPLWARTGHDYGLDVAWQFGCAVNITASDQPAMYIGQDNLIEGILLNKTGRFVQGIRWAAWDTRSANRFIDLLKEYSPRALHTVSIRDACDDEKLDYMRLFDFLPYLDHLVVEAMKANVGTMTSPLLKQFVLNTPLTPADLKKLCASRLPALETLQLGFLDKKLTRAYADALSPLLSGTVAPKLKKLAFSLASGGGDALLDALPGSKIATQLESLYLYAVGLTEEGAFSLAQHKDAFPKLKELNVEFNGLSPAALKPLKKAFGKRLAADRQQRPRNEEEYD